MFDKEKFIKRVYEKYDNLENDKELLDNKFIENKSNLKFIPQIAAACILTIGVGAFAYTEIINKEKEIEQTMTNYAPSYNEETGKYNNFYQENESDNGTAFKKIVTYNEYLEFINMYGNLIEMSKEEFDENFILVVEAYENMNIVDIYSDDTTLYIKLEVVDFNINIDKRGLLSTKVSNNLNRENIEIEIIHKISDKDKYVSVEDLPDNYSPEDAISDGYVVEGYMSDSLAYDNMKKIDEFIEDTKLGNENTIRIISFKESHTVYTDIAFKDGTYNVIDSYKFMDDERSFVVFYGGIEFVKTSAETADGIAIRYRLYEDTTHNDDGRLICWFRVGE